MVWKKVAGLTVLFVLSGVISSVAAQDGDETSIRQKLGQTFTQTKFRSDWSDIIQPGSVVTLKKDGLLTFQATVPAAPISVYKGGKLTQGFGDMLKVDMADGLGRAGGANSIPKKTLSTGEKCWVGAIEVTNDHVLMELVTNAFDDGRYFGILKFQFPKKNVPSADELMGWIDEVVDVDNSQVAGQQPPAPPQPPTPPQQDAATSPQPALAPLAPPPPPTDAPPPAPKTISLGQTKAQVVAAFGPPQKVVQLGEKEIDYYPDMKVTFLNGQVADVQ